MNIYGIIYNVCELIYEMYNMGGIYMYAIIIITSWKWVKYILELEDNRIWIKVHTVKYTQSTFTNVISKFSLREW